MRLIGVGEILWDVIGEREHLGGAVFNLCAHAARLGHEAYLVSAVAGDARGQLALQRACEFGVHTRFLKTVPEPPTGAVTVTVDTAGEPAYVIHRPAAYDFTMLDETDFAELQRLNPDWVTFGTLFSMQPNGKRILNRILDRLPSSRRFYDVNLRKDSFTPELVGELLAFSDVVKMNAKESEAVAGIMDWPAAPAEAFCRRLADQFDCECVCITRGGNGCALLLTDVFAESPSESIQVVDAVGAGDAFAAALIHAMDQGMAAREAAQFANQAGALVVSRSGALPEL
jgi:fructokinase